MKRFGNVLSRDIVMIVALACTVCGMAFAQEKPADIIIAVDNSGSMVDEAGFVQANLNLFTSSLFLAGIDYHLVLISADSSDSAGICVPTPTGSGTCPDDTSLPSYLHIADGVGSNNALDKIIAHFATWAPQMRPEAPKHLIVVTDDESSLSAADFDTAFLALDPNHAGYTFHSIASPEDPVLACVEQSSCCPDFVPLAAALGQQYIDLVALTDGVFNNICLQDFTPFFNEVAQAVFQSIPLVFLDGFENSAAGASDADIQNQQ